MGCLKTGFAGEHHDIAAASLGLGRDPVKARLPIRRIDNVYGEMGLSLTAAKGAVIHCVITQPSN